MNSTPSPLAGIALLAFNPFTAEEQKEIPARVVQSPAAELNPMQACAVTYYPQVDQVFAENAALKAQLEMERARNNGFIRQLAEENLALRQTNSALRKSEEAKDKIIAHLVEQRFEKIFKRLIKVVEKTPTLKQGLGIDPKCFENEDPKIVFQLLEKRLQSIHAHPQTSIDAPTPDGQSQEDIMAIVTEFQEIQKILNSLGKQQHADEDDGWIHLSIHMTKDEYVHICKEEQSSTALSKLVTGICFTGKVLKVIYTETLRIGTFVGVGAVVIQSPWTGSLLMLLRLLDKVIKT